MSELAITGRGVISPIGSDIVDFELGLDAGTVPFRLAEWSDPSQGKFAFESPVLGFQPSDWMSERVVEGTNRAVQMGIAAAVQAVEESGVELDPLRTAIVVGTSGGGNAVAEAQRAYDLDGPENVPPKLTLTSYLFFCASQLAMRWGLHGPIMTLDHACAAGLDAIGQGARLIEVGDADIVVAVGTHAAMPEVYRFSAYGPPRVPIEDSERASDPLRQCMPFDVNRINLVGAEGAAAVVVERTEAAAKRGARVFAALEGYASLSDGYHPTAPNPTGEFEALVMSRAQERSGVEPSEVDALIAHGTSTQKGDLAELAAINDVFRERSSPLPVTSTKGQLGHMAAGSGIASIIAGIHSMDTGKFTKTANTLDVEPAAEFEVVTREHADVKIDLLQVNSFGFGGHNSSMILSRTRSL